MTHPTTPAQCPECGGQLTTARIADCQQTLCLDEYGTGCRWSRAMWGAGGNTVTQKMVICELARKRIYVSHDDAVRAAGDTMGPYICRLCLYWHVGHSTKQRKQERRRHLQQMVRDAEAAGLYEKEESDHE